MRIAILATILAMAGGGASAQVIENACLRSDREGRGRAICGCIQQAANLTLTAKDQRLASSFYGDPQRAQDVRQSGRPGQARFWERYKNYAEIAEIFCG